MPSVVGICNLALARLGDEATVVSIEPPEGSAQAQHCATFYPIARDSLLELHDWKFATGRAPLSLRALSAAPWTYAYAVPNLMLRAVAVLPPSAKSDQDAQPYAIEAAEDGSQILVTDTPNAVLRYTKREADPARFSPLFTDALAALLASYLAGPVLKGDVGKAEAKAQLQHFELLLARAKVSDANQQRVVPDHTPAWIAGR